MESVMRVKGREELETRMEEEEEEGLHGARWAVQGKGRNGEDSAAQ